MNDIETIYREYKEKVYGFLLHKINNYAVAEDLCSDVFIKITENISKFDNSKASLSTWIYNITRNTLYDYFRTNRPASELNEEITAGDDFADEICTEETLDTLADALMSLSEREREIIIRRYYRGDTLNKIATLLGISYSYVKILHTEALKKLKKYFENH